MSLEVLGLVEGNLGPAIMHADSHPQPPPADVVRLRRQVAVGQPAVDPVDLVPLPIIIVEHLLGAAPAYPNS